MSTQRITIKIATILLFLSILFLILSCGRKEAEWQAQKFKENGVPVIINPKEPLYGEIRLEIEKNLSIGNEIDENYMFYRVRGIAIDNEENIYVLDSGNYRIQKFDKNGRYLRTIGRRGQGPGEFNFAYGFFIDVHNNLYVDEYSKIQIFNSQGKYERSINLATSIVNFAVDSEGNILANTSFRRGEEMKNEIVKMNFKEEIVKKVAEFSVFGPKIIITKNATWTLYPNSEYRPLLILAAISKSSYVYGFSSDYQIIKIDNNGNPLLKIRKKETPHFISKKEKEYIIERHQKIAAQRGMNVSRKIVEEACHFSRFRPFFKRIIVDNKQRLYIQKVKSVIDKNEYFEFDIFSKNGYYMYKTNLSFSPEIIHKGYLYNIYLSQETGEVKILRYKIRNWDTIKELEKR